MSDVGEVSRRPFWLDALSTGSQAEQEAEGLAITFVERPRPLLARQRIAYRTAVLLLTLDGFNQHAASVANLHIVLWAMRSARTRQMFKNWWTGRREIDFVSQRIEPTLDVSVRLALADGLVTLVGSPRHRLALTERGENLADVVAATDQLLVAEKELLAAVGRMSDAAFERKMGVT
jgi:hypothetical protein